MGSYTALTSSVTSRLTTTLKAKAKAKDSYTALLTGKPDQLRFTIIEVAVDR